MKILLWCLVSVGLLPCAFIAFQGVLFQQMLALEQRMLSLKFNGSVFSHDRYFRVEFGSWKLELFPRLWAFALLTSGIIAIIVSLIVLVHIPTTRVDEQVTANPTNLPD